MSSQVYADRLVNAITKTGMVEVVQNSFMENRVTVLFRVRGGVEPRWNDTIKNILLATDFFAQQPHRWHAHICKTFFLKTVKNQKNLVFGWTISITAEDIPHALDEVIRVIGGGDPEPKQQMGPTELTEFPLVGAAQERNAPDSKGKGAYSVGGRSDFRPPVRR